MQHESCPISFVSINNTILRLVSFFNTLLVGLYLYTDSAVIVLYIIFDNLLRLGGYLRFSPIFRLSEMLNLLLQLKKEPYDIGPKKFAVTIGTAMLVVVLFPLGIVSTILASVMMVLLILDSVLNYCVGCKMYSMFQRFRHR